MTRGCEGDKGCSPTVPTMNIITLKKMTRVGAMNTNCCLQLCCDTTTHFLVRIGVLDAVHCCKEDVPKESHWWLVAINCKLWS